MNEHAIPFWPNLQFLIPVLISLISLLISVHLNHKQDLKWQALNQPRIKLETVYLSAFDELTSEECFTRNWGYSPLVFSVVKDGICGKFYRLYNDLVFIDAKSNQRIFGHRTMLTAAEAENETKRLKLVHPKSIKKHLQFNFAFKNVGQLPAQDISLRIEQMESDGLAKMFHSVRPVCQILPDETFSVAADAYLPLGQPFPEEVKMKITYSYQWREKTMPLVVRYVHYDARRNYWTWVS